MALHYTFTSCLGNQSSCGSGYRTRWRSFTRMIQSRCHLLWRYLVTLSKKPHICIQGRSPCLPGVSLHNAMHITITNHDPVGTARPYNHGHRRTLEDANHITRLDCTTCQSNPVVFCPKHRSADMTARAVPEKCLLL